MTKELYVSIMEKYLKEMEIMTEINLKLIWDNDPKHTSNLAKKFYKKNIVKNRLAYFSFWSKPQREYLEYNKVKV